LIVIHRSEATWLERHAAEEFTEYASEITGKRLKIIADKDLDIKTKEDIVSVGETAIVGSLGKKGLLKVRNEDLERDGFIIKSVKDGGMRYLVLLGGSPRGTLYAVYDYLERFCHVGFFWDGEQIPRLDEIPTEGIDVTEKPRFKEREYLQPCVYGYTTAWWDWPEWKREIEWTVKKKLSIILAPISDELVLKRVMKRFGVKVPNKTLSGPPYNIWQKYGIEPINPLRWQEFQAGLVKQIYDYARKLGIRTINPGFSGNVPLEFSKAYPESRFMGVKWGGFPAQNYIDPTDPLFERFGGAYIKEYNEAFGTDHLYFVSAYAEQRPGTTREEQLKIKKAFAKAVVKTISSADPEGVWCLDSWAFIDKEYWPKEDVKAFLDLVPVNRLLILELWCDCYPLYKYAPANIFGIPAPRDEGLDYFFGKRWTFGVLHSFGGNTNMHGDVADLIRRVKDAASDPKANLCVGFSMMMEIIHHNYLYYDLVTKLAWNPNGIELDGFLQDYAMRRYGEKSAPKMVECLKELVSSVYSTNDIISPLYWLRLGVTLQPWLGTAFNETITKRKTYIPHLQAALDIALGETEAQRDNPMYVHDVVDISRQFLGDLFNAHVMRLYAAFKKGDTEAFEEEASKLAEIMDSVEMLLSSHDDYCLQPIIDKARTLPGAPKDVDRRIRDFVTSWAGQIIDYARKDAYELVRFYYRRRVDAFVQYLRGKLAEGSKEIRDEELAPIYHKIEQEWVKKPFKVEMSDKYPGTPVEAAAEVLRRHRLTEEELQKL